MEFVKVQQEEFVKVVTIDRPKALNALNKQVIEELDEVFSAIDLDTTRAIILTGSGDKSFVAGADIGFMSDMTKKEGEDWGNFANAVFRKIELCPVPVIAAINGYALGGGNEISTCCDIRLCSDTAVFGQPEVGLGITPGFGGTQRLARVIGSLSKAKEIIFAARNIKAEEALQIGLVSAVYPLEDLMPQAMKLAKAIAAVAPIAVRNCKTAINEGIEMDIDRGLRLEAALFGNCFETADQKEGMGAFLEKRKEKTFVNR